MKIVNDRYDSELKEFKKRMINNFKGVILQKAKDLEKENEVS